MNLKELNLSRILSPFREYCSKSDNKRWNANSVSGYSKRISVFAGNQLKW